MAAWANRRLGVPLLIVVLLLQALTSAPAVAASSNGFSVRQGRLVDGYGNDFIMRGINHPHSWFADQAASLSDIKATGANTVRIVLSTGARFARSDPNDVASLINRCRRAKLVCVLEVHDTTGYPGVDGSISLDVAVDYWIDNLATVEGHESFVIINIGNEPFDNETFGGWAEATASAVTRLRDAGFEHTLMIDAPNWGQDWSFVMRDGARTVFEGDPNRNLLFDIHMYGVFDDGQKVRSYLEHFVRQELPIVIGEFGASHTDGDPDEVAIMHWAEMYGIGYLAWSWSGNRAPVLDLNVVRNFDPTDRTEWGSQLLDGPRGISETSNEATIFGEPSVAAPPLLAAVPSISVGSLTEPELALIAHVEAEDATYNGLQTSVVGAGFSGDGFVTGFDTRGDSITVTAFVERAGTYDLSFGYRSPYGDKIQQVTINQTRHGGVTFPESPDFTHVRLEAVVLHAGENRIRVTHDWGWMDLDYVQVWGAQDR